MTLDDLAGMIADAEALGATPARLTLHPQQAYALSDGDPSYAALHEWATAHNLRVSITNKAPMHTVYLSDDDAALQAERQ